MAKFDIGDLFKKTSESIQKGVESIQQNPDIANAMTELGTKSAEAMQSLKKMGDETAANVQNLFQNNKDNAEKHPDCITVKGALTLFYFVMASDHDIKDEENEQYTLIGKETDSEFEAHRSSWTNEFKSMIHKLDPDNFEVELHFLIKDVIRKETYVKEATVKKRLLLWNLLAIAYSDGEASDVEIKLIRYIARNLELDQSILSEMELTMGTMNSIQREEAFVKESNRPYNVVEPLLNELADRRLQLMKSIEMLVID